MDRKRKSINATASTSKRKRTSSTPRPASPVRRYRRVTKLGESRISNIQTNAAKRLQDVKVIKVPNRRAGPGGFTIVATPRAKIGDSGVIDGVRYTIRSQQQLRDLIRQKKWSEVERTCTSRITNMSRLFDMSQFNGVISHWDTANVTTMQKMFRESHFNQPICGWNTGAVRDMSRMFLRAMRFKQPIGNWNTGAVTTMESTFKGACYFNQPIGNWNTGAVTTMTSMFEGAHYFDQPLGGWNTSAVRDMSNMFNGASRFNRPISNWNTSKVMNMMSMFEGASCFNQPIGNWNTGAVTTMKSMFEGASRFNRPISNWNTGAVRDMSRMFMYASCFNQPIGLDTSAVTTMASMFQNASRFNQPVGNWNTSAVTTMKSMFQNASRFNQPVGNWNTRAVRDMSSVFKGASRFNQPVGNWNTSEVSIMCSMFEGASRFNQPIGNWNTGAVITMVSMFKDASYFNQPIGNWNTGAVTNMSSMFEGASRFNQPIGGWNMCRVNFMTRMLYKASSFIHRLPWKSARCYKLPEFVKNFKYIPYTNKTPETPTWFSALYNKSRFIARGEHGGVYEIGRSGANKLLEYIKKLPKDGGHTGVAQLVPPGTRVVMKVSYCRDAADSIVAHQEVKVLRALKGLRLVPKFYGSVRFIDRVKDRVKDAEYSIVIMGLVDGKPIESILRPGHPVRLKNPYSIQKVRRGLNSALIQMWKKGVIHTDLHSNNIVVTKNSDVYIIDFGNAVLAPRLKKLASSFSLTDDAVALWKRVAQTANFSGMKNGGEHHGRLDNVHMLVHLLPYVKRKTARKMYAGLPLPLPGFK